MNEPEFTYRHAETMSTEQTRRTMCLAAALLLLAGRATPWTGIVDVARWLYDGEGPGHG